MEDGRAKSDLQCIQIATDQQQQSTEDITENQKSPSELCVAVGDHNLIPQVPVQKANGCRTASHKGKWKKRGASRMMGFMFWTNAAAVVLLLIGFASPGWLTVKSHQEVPYHTDVYQDYALWYVTQCYDYGDGSTCQTMTYRTLDAAFEKPCSASDCVTITIGSLKIDDTSSLLFFSIVALVFSYSDIVRSQACYTVGLFLALSTLYICHTFRKNVARERRLGVSKKSWIVLFILGLLSAMFVFIAVSMFTTMVGRIGNDYDGNVLSPLGVVFAGVGGGLMVLCIAAVLLHLICCRKENDLYLCSTGNESGTQATEEEKDM